MALVLAIDFDGVLHDSKAPVPGYRMGPPVDRAKESMLELRRAGHTLIVHSVWGNKTKVIGDWMDFYKIPYDDITNVKPVADYYIDNKAITFTTWEEVLDAIH